MKPKITAFYTRQGANEGRPFDMPLPNGKPSGVTLTVHGYDSDQFTTAARKHNKRVADIDADKEQTDDERDAAKRESGRVLLADIVSGWTADEDFSREAITTLFREAPYIQKRLNEWLADDSNFAVKP